MSFKSFSTSQTTPGNNQPGDKAKTAPSKKEPAPNPATKQDETASAQK